MKKSIKFIAAAFIFGLFGNTLFGSENFKFSITPESGFVNGHIYEYVVWKDSDNERYNASKLDWEIINIPYFQLNGNLDLFQFVNLSGAISTLIPKASGNLQDYDWLDTDDHTILTNYSIHDNYLKNNLSGHVTLGLNIEIYDFWKCIPFISYDYDWIRFDSYNGYRTYRSENWEKIEMNGRAISYLQQHFIGGLGTTNIFTFGDKFQLVNEFYFSPGLDFCLALDYHWNESKKILFQDVIYGNQIIRGSFSVNYSFNKHSICGIKFKYSKQPYCIGPDSYNEMDADDNLKYDEFIPNQDGGTSSFLWSLGISYTYSF